MRRSKSMTGIAMLLLCAFRSVSAQDADELKKRYKNTPGGDIIAAQIEAHRAQIDAANAKQNASMKKQGLGGAVKSAKEILALIPAAPKSVAEAKSRLGKIDDGSGDGKKIDGDARSGAAAHELANLMMDRVRHPAAAASGSGSVRPGQGEAIKKLGEGSRKLALESQTDFTAFQTTLEADNDALTKSVDAVVADYRTKFGGDCEGGEGAHPNAAKCQGINARYRAALSQAREAYVRKAGADILAYRTKADARVAGGDAMLAEAKAVLSSGPLAPMASVQYGQIENAQLSSLQALIGANSALTTHAAEKDVVLYGN